MSTTYRLLHAAVLAAAHCFGVLRCAFAMLVASLRYPTIRRCFVIAREMLRAAGREYLADELLRLLGSLALSRAEVETIAAEAERAYDVAVEVRRTPVVMDWNVSRDARELERAAVRELIDAGHHREAMFQLLLVRTVVQGIIENDGGEEARASARIGYQRLLAGLGIDGDHPNPWELYDMTTDRCELHDRAAAHPDIVQELGAAWQAWAERVGVIPWETTLDIYRQAGKLDREAAG